MFYRKHDHVGGSNVDLDTDERTAAKANGPLRVDCRPDAGGISSARLKTTST